MLHSICSKCTLKSRFGGALGTGLLLGGDHKKIDVQKKPLTVFSGAQAFRTRYVFRKGIASGASKVLVSIELYLNFSSPPEHPTSSTLSTAANHMILIQRGADGILLPCMSQCGFI